VQKFVASCNEAQSSDGNNVFRHAMKPSVLPFALFSAGLVLSAQQINKQRWFEYDASASLDYRETLISTREGVRV
jgi:hypothetical protein